MDGLKQNKPCLNIAKWKYMVLGNNKQVCKSSEIGNINVNNDEIINVNKIIYLDLFIDESLSWNQQ